MAYGRQRGVGCAVATAFALAVLVLVVAAWLLGAFDRLLYLAHVESGRAVSVSQIEQRGSGQEDRYVYSQLPADEKEKYLLLLGAFQTREPVAFPETDMDELSHIRDCVMADHPELFYVDGVQMATRTNRGSGLVMDVSVEGQYSFSKADADVAAQQLEAAASACLAGIPEGADDYGKAKYLYEWLVENVEYDQGAAAQYDEDAASSGQTAYDALVTGKAVCAGYARAYQLMLQRLGIECVYVTGAVADGTHAWCAVRLDGAWYFIDPTWGDPQFSDDSGRIYDAGHVNYDYLCVTNADIDGTHAITCSYAVPVCAASADNYYIREGLYLVEPDVEAAGAIIQAALDRGESSVSLRCSNRAVFDQLIAELIDGQAVYRFILGTSCTYSLNDHLCTLTLHF